MQPIGIVRTEATEEDFKTKREEVLSRIIVDEQYTEALVGIEDYSHVFVIYWGHLSSASQLSLKVHPRGRQDLPLVGLFATRSIARPNPIGLTVVELLGRDRNILYVKGLDAIDQTPVLDIKPYDYIDLKQEIAVPQWFHTMTGGRYKPTT